MKIPIEGGKYAICVSDNGSEPEGGKMLVSAAYELYCLRKITAAALDVLNKAKPGESMQRAVDSIHNLRAAVDACKGLMDFKMNLKDPGTL